MSKLNDILAQTWLNIQTSLFPWLSEEFRRAILPHEILGTPVTKYSLTYGANWISPSTPCVRFNYAQKPLR